MVLVSPVLLVSGTLEMVTVLAVEVAVSIYDLEVLEDDTIVLGCCNPQTDSLQHFLVPSLIVCLYLGPPAFQ